MFFSVIIPVFNRPSEALELLASLSNQSFEDFEVILVEDGSVNKADQIASSFQSMGLNNKYSPAIRSFTRLYAIVVPLLFIMLVFMSGMFF